MKHNPVAKHLHKFNKPKVHRDRKKESKRVRNGKSETARINAEDSL